VDRDFKLTRFIISATFALGLFFGAIAAAAGLALGLTSGNWIVLWIGLALIAIGIVVPLVLLLYMYVSVRLAGRAELNTLRAQASADARLKAELDELRQRTGPDAAAREYLRRKIPPPS
jgi:hypothetical protein